MVTAWRVVRDRYSGTAFDGGGARRAGGRFNSRGTGVVYAADSLALAILEILVHLPSYRGLDDRVAFRLTFEDDLVERLQEDDLPADWRSPPASRTTQYLGDEWVAGGRSAVLSVPSVVVQQEANFVLNPAHPTFAQIAISEPIPVALDPRLAK